MIFAAVTDLLARTVRMLSLIDTKFTENTCQHGRYCVSDEKIGRRTGA